MLTPAYAAPEQFEGGAITVATDVYQLGLLLYGLITGRRAVDADGTTPETLRHDVCTTDPARPSVAATGPAAVWARRLPGDLDAIVMKAIRKSPADRYATVEALRRDLDNFVAHRPVAARQGTGLYAVRKYVRRHPAPVAAASAALAASVIGMVAVVWQARATAAERDRAVAAEQSAEAVNSFLVNELLAAPMPERSQGRELTVVEVLGTASTSVGFALESSPIVQAQVRSTLARSYLALGRTSDAGEHAAEAHRLVTNSAGSAPTVIAARRLLVDIELAKGNSRGLREEIDAILETARRQLGPAHPETLLAQLSLTRVLSRHSEFSAAEVIAREADTLVHANPETPAEVGTAVRTAYIDALLANQKPQSAMPLIRQQIEHLTARFGPTHARLVPVMRQQARALNDLLEYEEAVTATEAQVRLHEQLYGADHPATLRVMSELRVAYDRATRDAQSLETARRTLEIQRRVLGDDHPDTLSSLRSVAISLRKNGDAAGAVPLFREVAEGYAKMLGELDSRAIEALSSLPRPLLTLGRTAEARQVGESVVARFERVVANPNAEPHEINGYAMFLIDAEPKELRDPQKAVALAQRAVAATGRGFPFLKTLARAYWAAGDATRALATALEASATPAGLQSFETEDLIVQLMTEHAPEQLEAWLLGRLDRLRRERGPEEYLLTRTLNYLARHYVKADRNVDAETRLREALDVLSRSVPATHFMVAITKSDLGERLLARGALAEAEPLLLAGFEGMLTSRRPTLQRRALVRDRVVRLYEAMNRPAEAKKYRELKIPTFGNRE